MIQVVAALLQKDGKYLVCQRPAGKSRALKWEFPGGKIEPGETLQQAIIRELEEELGISVKAIGKVGSVLWNYSDVSIHLHLLSCNLRSGTLILREHMACQWVTREEALELDLAPADRALLEKINF